MKICSRITAVSLGKRLKRYEWIWAAHQEPWTLTFTQFIGNFPRRDQRVESSEPWLLMSNTRIWTNERCPFAASVVAFGCFVRRFLQESFYFGLDVKKLLVSFHTISRRRDASSFAINPRDCLSERSGWRDGLHLRQIYICNYNPADGQVVSEIESNLWTKNTEYYFICCFFFEWWLISFQGFDVCLSLCSSFEVTLDCIS